MTEHDLWQAVADEADGRRGLCFILWEFERSRARYDAHRRLYTLFRTEDQSERYGRFWRVNKDGREARLNALGFLLAMSDPHGPNGPEMTEDDQ